MKDFEFIEHTADMGIRVYGENIGGLFKNAATVLFKLLTDYQPRGDKEKEITLVAETLDELFVNWLNELISSFFTYNFISADYFIDIEEKPNSKILKARIAGEDFDAYKNKINTEIKAATYHDLKIKKTDEGYMAEVIFDV